MGEWKDKVMWRDPTPSDKTEREQQLELESEQTKIEKSWQQVRIQAAVAAMQAHICDEEYMSRISRNLKQDDNEIVKFVVKCSVMYADALVAELQKKGVEDE